MRWLQAIACGMFVTLRMPCIRMILIAVGCAGFKAISTDSGHSRQQLARINTIMDGCCQACQFLFCANVLFPIICKRKVSQSDGRREPMISAMRGVQCQDLDWLELDWQLEYNKRKPIATLELTWINHKLRVLFRAQSGFFLTIILSLKRGLCGEVFFLPWVRLATCPKTTCNHLHSYCITSTSRSLYVWPKCIIYIIRVGPWRL